MLAAAILAVVGPPGVPHAGVARAADGPPGRPRAGGRELGHEETLRWIGEHRAWRLARKSRPIWARPVAADKVGQEFQTADGIKEVARAGY